MNLLNGKDCEQVARKLIFSQVLQINNFFSSKNIETDCLLILLATFDGPIPKITAGGKMPVKIALKMIREISEEIVPSSNKVQLIEHITKARMSPDWDVRARVLLVWESGMAFQLLEIGPITCLAGLN